MSSKKQAMDLLEVHHPAIGVVAAKVMKNEFFDENEWNIAGIFQSDPPHICPFIIRNILARKFEEMTVILLENANMDNLQKLIEANVDIPLATVRVIMKQLFEGLRYIHFKGIIHRDIKPANILLHSPPDSGRVLCKIGDFGEVKIKSGDNKLTLMTFRGTAVYMAPELFLGDRHEQKQADNTVDIWSLGIVLYQIMTHTFPFDTSTQPAILSFMTTKVLARPHQILDDNLWDLLMRMLSFDRENRISAEDALKHPFFTSEKALSEITEEQRQLALITQQNIDKNVSYFDINPSFILTLNEVQRILGKVDLVRSLSIKQPLEIIT
ncbi:MAG: putative CAMK/CAMK1 protein kinase [Streblomastix strix]|uniref:Putative CAMK/CAMK1 protein kinase n=1 Tax=Streblomastix strix TaxID=222440 RepID=A0A5J4WDC7_9EUKA|nr:MAG: putative CAMK/CAMK1 protein kinase [Streblomastix strix]